MRLLITAAIFLAASIPAQAAHRHHHIIIINTHITIIAITSKPLTAPIRARRPIPCGAGTRKNGSATRTAWPTGAEAAW